MELKNIWNEKLVLVHFVLIHIYHFLLLYINFDAGGKIAAYQAVLQSSIMNGRNYASLISLLTRCTSHPSESLILRPPGLVYRSHRCWVYSGKVTIVLAIIILMIVAGTVVLLMLAVVMIILMVIVIITTLIVNVIPVNNKVLLSVSFHISLLNI